MNNQLITKLLASADTVGQTEPNIVDIAPFVIAAVIVLVVLLLIFVIRKIHKKVKLKREINKSSNNKGPSLESNTIEEMDSALKSIYDEIGMNAVKNTQRLMKEELEKNLGEYRDDETYMLPEEKARQILLEMIKLAVVQRNNMINQFIHSTAAGKIYSVIDCLVDELDSYDNDARTKFRTMKDASKEMKEAEVRLERLRKISVRQGKEEAEPSKEDRDGYDTNEQQDNEEYEKDVQG